MLISAFIYGGNPFWAIIRLRHSAEIWLSPPVIEEYRSLPGQLQAQGKITRQQKEHLTDALATFVARARITIARREVRLCRDSKDDMLLECCSVVGANLLITGDRDLLEIPRTQLRRAGLGRLKILTPRQYLERSRRP